MYLNIIGSGMKTKEEVLAYMKAAKWYDYFVKNLETKVNSYVQPLIRLGYNDLDSYLHYLITTNSLGCLICDCFTWRYSEYPTNIRNYDNKHKYWEKIDFEYKYWYDT